jgi:hypothetical protein
MIKMLGALILFFRAIKSQKKSVKKILKNPNLNNNNIIFLKVKLLNLNLNNNKIITFHKARTKIYIKANIILNFIILKQLLTILTYQN